MSLSGHYSDYSTYLGTSGRSPGGDSKTNQSRNSPHSGVTALSAFFGNLECLKSHFVIAVTGEFGKLAGNMYLSGSIAFGLWIIKRIHRV